MLQFGGYFMLKSIEICYIWEICFLNIAFFQKHSSLLAGLQPQCQYQMCEILVDEWPKVVLVLVSGTRE